MFERKTGSVSLSIPSARKVRGYTIGRMPIGQFLKALQRLEELPAALMSALFPGMDAGGILKALSAITKDELQALFLRAAAIVPQQAIELFAELSGLEAHELLEDPNVGLDGLAELLTAWTEVNGFENFMKAAGALAVKVRNWTGKAGSNG